MSIAFDLIPSTNRVPKTMAEVDPSRALAVQPGEIHRVLMIGLKLSTGSAPAGVIVPITSELAGDALFNDKAQLAGMTRGFKRVNTRAKLYALPVDENAAGTAATGTFAITGTATKDGTLTTRIGDQRISTFIASGTTAAAAATAHAASINATARCPFSAAAATGTVTITFRSKGTPGNDVTIETVSKPTGLDVADTQPSGGATNPALAATIAAIDSSRYDTIVTGITDAANVLLLENEASRRWLPTVQKYAHVIGAVRGSVSTETTYGNGRNSEHSTIMGAGLSPTPPWIWAAQVAARDAEVCDSGLPNRPRNGLTLPDCEAPKLADQFDDDDNNACLYDGISTYKVDPSGRVLIERLITTYQVNTAGLADATYLAIETVRNLAALLNDFLALGAKHNRDLLGPDGKNVSPGIPLTTPKTMRGEIIALYKLRERGGRVKDTDGFARDLIVELSESDVERMDVHAAPRLVNGLVTQAFKVSFQL